MTGTLVAPRLGAGVEAGATGAFTEPAHDLVVRDDADFELLYFDFENVGPAAPQAMQVYCQRDSGRVVEITLSAARRAETQRAKSE